MISNEEVGRRLEAKRKEALMTQNQLAELLYVTPQAVSRWETGKGTPSIEIMLKVAEIFQVSISYFLEEDLTLERISHRAPVKKDIYFYVPEQEYAPIWAEKIRNQQWIESNWINR